MHVALRTVVAHRVVAIARVASVGIGIESAS
jgi:hypothetical protein